MRIARKLTWFEKKGEEFVGEVVLRGARLADLQALFNVAKGDPMYECFAVKSKHVKALRQWTDAEIDLKRYDYFIEASAVRTSRPALSSR